MDTFREFHMLLCLFNTLVSSRQEVFDSLVLMWQIFSFGRHVLKEYAYTLIYWKFPLWQEDSARYLRKKGECIPVLAITIEASKKMLIRRKQKGKNLYYPEIKMKGVLKTGIELEWWINTKKSFNLYSIYRTTLSRCYARACRIRWDHGGLGLRSK